MLFSRYPLDGQSFWQNLKRRSSIPTVATTERPSRCRQNGGKTQAMVPGIVMVV